MPRTFLGTTYRKIPLSIYVLFPLFLCTNLNFGSSSLRHRCSPGASGGPDIRGHLEATVNVRQCLWSTRFVCRHYEAEYQKRPSDNSRASRHILRCSCPASCLMKAISVRILAMSSSFCSHSSRLIPLIEDTDIWFCASRPKRFHLANCVMPSIGLALRPDCL